MKLHHKNFKYIEFKPQKWNSEKEFLPFYWQRNINCRTDCDFNAEDLFGRKLQWNSLWETKIHWSQNKTLTETNKRSRINPTRLFWIFQPNEIEFTMTFIVSRWWSGSLNVMERAVCLNSSEAGKHVNLTQGRLSPDIPHELQCSRTLQGCPPNAVHSLTKFSLGTITWVVALLKRLALKKEVLWWKVSVYLYCSI